MKKRNGMSLEDAGKIAYEKARQEKLKRIERYKQRPNTCTLCDAPLSYDKRRNKYCSHSCAATANNHGKQRNISTVDKIQIDGKWYGCRCLNCNKPTMNNKFCSNKCVSLFSKSKRRAEIKKSGKLSGRNEKWFVEEQRGKVCEICKNNKWMGNAIPLDIHHLDGDSDNHLLSNIQLLCPNCHRMTNNYGSKNKQKRSSKRKIYRNKRYKNGESY